MSEPDWILRETVLCIHDETIVIDGGCTGVRDEGLLDSALARPKNLSIYNQSDLYTLAAAYAYGLCYNHPFIDGNKRTAFIVCILFLKLSGYHVFANKFDKIKIFTDLSKGLLTQEALALWFRNNTCLILKT